MLKIRIGLLRDLQRNLSSLREQTDAQLRANEKACRVSEDAIARVDVAQLAANRPIEDCYAAAKCLSSNAYLFGVFDGHGGGACGRHVSVRLYDYICAAVLQKHTVRELPLKERLRWLFSSVDRNLPTVFKNVHEQNVENFHRHVVSNANVTNVRKSLQAAFCALDEDISRGAKPVNKPGCANKNIEEQVDGKKMEHFDLRKTDFERMSLNVAMSGSCALVAHIREDHLHVANVGDSCAVLGVSDHGATIARLMSRAHCIDNADEVERIRKAHPICESMAILRGGRLLSELYPLRAFGDVRYKWPETTQKELLEPFGSSLPPGLQTPPYLTAIPEVFYHHLTPNDRFLVLASDGLWEWLEPDVVVRLVSDHSLGAQTLTPYQPKPGINIDQVNE
ncbi:hypothetical protein AB6A40_007854 [Gnathostoma spinigerum]|uniref:PPM-type phosphatase domain-containing protein n=1 Tax=Gnathostoma spinigerum TaxID=75299 RepID=A0ABD6ENP7_9BILA